MKNINIRMQYLKLNFKGLLEMSTPDTDQG